MLERRPYQDSPPRSGYHLSAGGRELAPVLHALRQWGDTWAVSAPPVTLLHHDHAFDAEWLCRTCHQPVDALELDPDVQQLGLGLRRPAGPVRRSRVKLSSADRRPPRFVSVRAIRWSVGPATGRIAIGRPVGGCSAWVRAARRRGGASSPVARVRQEARQLRLSVPSTGGALSKADSSSKMNAVCSAVYASARRCRAVRADRLHGDLGQPRPAPYGCCRRFITQADQLVGRSSDRATLTKNWLSIEKSDFAAVKPIAERMVADSNAKNADKVAADGEALSNAPNHSDTIATFMTSYGLTNCATLEQAGLISRRVRPA